MASSARIRRRRPRRSNKTLTLPRMAARRGRERELRGIYRLHDPKNGSWNALKWLLATAASGYAESSCHPTSELHGSRKIQWILPHESYKDRPTAVSRMINEDMKFVIRKGRANGRAGGPPEDSGISFSADFDPDPEGVRVRSRSSFTASAGVPHRPIARVEDRRRRGIGGQLRNI